MFDWLGKFKKQKPWQAVLITWSAASVNRSLPYNFLKDVLVVKNGIIVEKKNFYDTDLKKLLLEEILP